VALPCLGKVTDRREDRFRLVAFDQTRSSSSRDAELATFVAELRERIAQPGNCPTQVGNCVAELPER
jgi:hypothetical protein